jgi:predicted GNAT family acetyltransferase
MEIVHQDDGREGIFMLQEGEATAGELSYAWDGEGRVVAYHTGVRRAFEGRGLAKRLVDALVGFAREKEIKIVAQCPYVKALFAKSADYDDVKASDCG